MALKDWTKIGIDKYRNYKLNGDLFVSKTIISKGLSIIGINYSVIFRNNTLKTFKSKKLAKEFMMQYMRTH